MKNMKFTAPFLMFLAACIWGAAFVAQSEATKYIGPFTFNSIRFFLGALVLMPLIWVRKRAERVHNQVESKTNQENQTKAEKQSEQESRLDEETKTGKKSENWKAGIGCGIVLTAASLFQQYGIGFTSVGKAGFITALYIIIVPFLGLALGRKIKKSLFISLIAALTGLYLLCIKSGDIGSINFGDGMILICAFLFSCHILLIGHYAPKTDGIIVSCIQFLVGFVLSGIGAFLFETIEIRSIAQAYAPLLYAGILSCGVAYTLQIIAQKKLDPTIASLIGSLESVAAVVAAWLILGQTMSRRESVGSILVFAAILLAQLPEREKQQLEVTEI